MKTTLTAILLLPALVFSQPTLNNVEDFSNGTVLKFINCHTLTVSEGNAGPGQTWNFSNLVSTGDTMTEWMVLPSAVPGASLYPSANLVEKYSDGSFVFMNKTATQNLLVGYSDNGLNIKYNDPLLFAQRPVSYGSVFTDTFTSTFASGPYNFSGSGTVTIAADAYGTLILPSGTYPNVLRINTTQIQVDTLLQLAMTSTTTIKVITWFDANHTSALLKIDSAGSSQFSEKSVEYLLAESAAGIREELKPLQLGIYPSPAAEEVTINAAESGDCVFYNTNGQKIKTVFLTIGPNKISISGFKRGKYILQQRVGITNYGGQLLIND